MGHSTITNDDFSNFLACGAILRHSSKWYVYFTKHLSTTTSKCLESEAFSVFAQDFYDSNQFLGLRTASSEKEILTEAYTFCLSDVEWLTALEKFLDQNEIQGLVEKEWQQPDGSQFENFFRNLQNLFYQGDLQKAVPVLFEKTSWQVSIGDRAKILWNLTKRAPPDLWVYGLWDANRGFLGASPEMLFHMKANNLHSMALAGTRMKLNRAKSTHDKLSESLNSFVSEVELIKQQLLTDPKEIEEHQFVVTDLKEKLGSLESLDGTVKVSSMQVLELPNLLHLRTDLNAKLSRNEKPQNVIRSLHPSAALGVFPRTFDLNWLKASSEKYGFGDRGFFGAPVTFRIGSDEWLSVVGIRCLDWSDGIARIGSGCGIVEKSSLLNEWEELRQKRNSVKSLLWES